MSWNEICDRAWGLVKRYPRLLVDNPRVGRAMNIVRAGGVSEAGDQTYKVTSQSNPNKFYTVTKGRCECQDHKDGHLCKHRIAVVIYSGL